MLMSNMTQKYFDNSCFDKNYLLIIQDS